MPMIGALLGIDVGHWPAETRLDGGQRDFQSLRLVYEASNTGGELRPRGGRQHHPAAWIPLAEVAGLNRSRSWTRRCGSTGSGRWTESSPEKP